MVLDGSFPRLSRAANADTFSFTWAPLRAPDREHRNGGDLALDSSHPLGIEPPPSLLDAKASRVTTFARSIEVDAPQAWLFELMQDYDRRLAWDEFLEKAELVGGATASAVGVRAYCVDTSGRGMETEYVAFKPPERVAVKMTRGPWMFQSFAGSWAYRSLGEERTEITFRYSMELFPRVLGKLGDRLLARVFARDMERRLTSAKSRLERLYREAREASRHPC